ncbi:MAG: hypothetical protein ABSG02_03720 [Terriglobales bacterium]
MSVRKWSKSNAEYGRRLVLSGIKGARSAHEEFSDSLAPDLADSLRSALAPAVLGACIGVLGGSPTREKSVGRALMFGLLGGAIGLGAGLAWESRRLTARVVDGALRNIGRVRDEQWLIKNPINYA